MNIPNVLTLLRVFLTFIFAGLIYQENFSYKVAALIVFGVASFTDFLDGYLAKRMKACSNFGKIMDPIADKFLMLTAFFIFAQMGLIHAWMFIAIFFREILLTGLRLVAVGRGKVLAAEKLGKYKTVAQIIAVYLILIFMLLKNSSWGFRLTITTLYFWELSIYLLMLCTVFLTLVSGSFYLYNNKDYYER
ncbi:MAG TPA: CDP-diacylglycerol--glycerol-3-phosphate 3-phosphatidyltransferase [Candidatus Omnitrophota bacterium]|nr:CDP-diacylglycerol--glycerol-3-phosphate 3-phosphatidyltransferase [Candidatus Omnitrophota bacterium]HPN88045.1 CDP-diacylglycerol--glycerol-3-phosphate 3-phosphatidyltransferase [Candidatus Omnitrophota bacterium]